MHFRGTAGGGRSGGAEGWQGGGGTFWRVCDTYTHLQTSCSNRDEEGQRSNSALLTPTLLFVHDAIDNKAAAAAWLCFLFTRHPISRQGRCDYGHGLILLARCYVPDTTFKAPHISLTFQVFTFPAALPQCIVQKLRLY